MTASRGRSLALGACIILLCISSCTERHFLLIDDGAGREVDRLAGLSDPVLEEIAGIAGGKMIAVSPEVINSFRGEPPAGIIAGQAYASDLGEIRRTFPGVPILLTGGASSFNGASRLIRDRTSLLEALPGMLKAWLDRGLAREAAVREPPGGLPGNVRSAMATDPRVRILSSDLEITELLASPELDASGLLLVIPDGLASDPWRYLEGFRGMVVTDLHWDWPMPFRLPCRIVPDLKAAAQAVRGWAAGAEGDITVPCRMEAVESGWTDRASIQGDFQR